MRMKQAYGNLWEVEADLRVITTNGIVNPAGENVMGKGCALEARKKFPGVAMRLGELIELYGNHVHLVESVLPDDPYSAALASYPVKEHWRDPAVFELIERSAHELVDLVERQGYEQVVLPRPGCGNGHCDWRDVKPVLDAVFDDRFTIITFAPGQNPKPTGKHKFRPRTERRRW